MKHEAITCCILFSFHFSGNCEQSRRTDTRYELFFALISLLTQNTFHYKGACDNVGDLRLVHKRGDNFGAIQACIKGLGLRYFSSYGVWTEGAARLACRELNIGYLSKRL